MARLCLSLVAALCLGAGTAAAAPPEPAEPPATVLVVLENRELDEVIGNPEAPYLNHLAGKGALATNYFGVTHPSLPNYLALLGGSTFGIAENCTECTVPGPNLATQLSRAGISWRAYMGNLPRPCFTGASYGSYAKRHNPFAYFPSITSVPARCAAIVPEARLVADLRGHRLPAFSWLTPDLCDNAHDCSLATADSHLRQLAPRIIRRLGPHGLLVVTFDEGTGDGGCCGLPGGGRVATILVGPGVPAGTELRRPADHYSLLAALEDRFGLGRLRLARSARPLAPALFDLRD
ncbi:MAG TPA: alkaline phosphatase family protein [Solirubrobacterales bacterium]|nr:alkaline phosphatase family protein [Solirubrobacterales bacterium]